MFTPVKLLTLIFLSMALFAVACDTGTQSGSATESTAEEVTEELTTGTNEPDESEQPVSQENASSSPQDLTQRGMAIANRTFAVLSTELSRAINAGGVPAALEYCKLNAYPIVDSLSKANNAYIKRTSLRLRNPNNISSNKEEAMLKMYASAIDKNGNVDFKQLRPRLMDEGDHWAFYAPIKMQNAVCLKCHGKIGLNIENEDYAKIRELYPQDKAVGYSLGDLRGIWSIQFSK